MILFACSDKDETDHWHIIIKEAGKILIYN